MRAHTWTVCVASPDAALPDAPGSFVQYLWQKERIHAFRVEDRRLDIGSMAAYEEANCVLAKEPAIIA